MALATHFPKEPALIMEAKGAQDFLSFAHDIQQALSEGVDKGMGPNEYIQGSFFQSTFNVRVGSSTAEIADIYYKSRYNENTLQETGGNISKGLEIYQGFFIRGLADGSIPASQARALAQNFVELERLSPDQVRAEHMEKFALLGARVQMPEAFFGQANRPGVPSLRAG